MYGSIKRFLAWTMLVCLPLVAIGCGGGGGGGGDVGGTTTISGIAMKGPIKGASVGIFQLLPDGSSGDLLGNGTSGTDGKYAIQIPTSRASGPLLVVVKGQAGATYFSESRGIDVNFTAAESFSAMVDAADAPLGVTVSPLTDAAYQKLQQVITTNPGRVVDASFMRAVNEYVGSLFLVGNILADPASDPAYLAALRVIDQMVVDSNTSTTLAVMNIISQALVNPVTISPSYQAFQQVLIDSANKVLVTADPALTARVQALVDRIANPPAAPDFSDTRPPSAPSSLTARASALTATTSSVALTWNPSAPAALPAPASKNAVTGYDVFRNGIKIATVRTPGYIDPSVAPNITYVYHVVAFDAAGNRSVASNQVSVTPLPTNLGITINGQISAGILALPEINDFTPPSAPANLAATTTAVTSTASTVALTWNPSTDNRGVTGYDVFRDNSKIATVATPGYSDTVVPAVTFTYFLIAFDAAGNRSAAGSQISITPNQTNLGITVNGTVVGN